MEQLRAPVVKLANVSLHYGKTLALDDITLDIPAGRMIGLIGPDGVGKSSLLSLISGARAIQEGSIYVLHGDMKDRLHREAICPRIAYMPQGLGKNLYPTLSVEENLQFFARLFGHNEAERRRRIDELTYSTGLYPFLDRPAGKLSGGMKQKLGLCCSLIHDPDLLILDEPTTGVDPLARAQFWDLIDRVRAEQKGMSVIVATAYMDEAQRFDWLIAMDEGKILETGTPDQLLEQTKTDSLETAFIYLLPEEKRRDYKPVEISPLETDENTEIAIEAKELTMRFGKFVAVDHVNFRIRRGEISLAIEIPPNFARDVQRGHHIQIGVWVDGSMPQRAETIRGYIFGMHQGWLMEQAAYRLGTPITSAIDIETRFRYNPDVKSLPAIVPAVIPILLLMLPAMLTALAVVREKELGSIINLYVTPVTRTEFLIGKQIPYIALAMINYFLMVLLAVTIFDVPITGSVITLTIATFIYCIICTGMGLLASTFTRSQIAAMFTTMIATLLPAIQFSGMLNPVSSLDGTGRIIGEMYPTTHMLTISRGIFCKALTFSDLYSSVLALLITVPILLVLTILLLKKQDT